MKHIMESEITCSVIKIPLSVYYNCVSNTTEYLYVEYKCGVQT
jgi:hypothetical protein